MVIVFLVVFIHRKRIITHVIFVDASHLRLMLIIVVSCQIAFVEFPSRLILRSLCDLLLLLHIIVSFFYVGKTQIIALNLFLILILLVVYYHLLFRNWLLMVIG